MRVSRREPWISCQFVDSDPYWRQRSCQRRVLLARCYGRLGNDACCSFKALQKCSCFFPQFLKPYSSTWSCTLKSGLKINNQCFHNAPWRSMVADHRCLLLQKRFELHEMHEISIYTCLIFYKSSMKRKILMSFLSHTNPLKLCLLYNCFHAIFNIML